ncbi:MAG: hypothetical protein D6755_08345 [Anaerolineae bacterium]|nr:MAG: hypothetical protein D6755_08345 [Anaerolineae bacterium]
MNFSTLYAAFDAPVTALDCGEKCAPYNEHGVPFCCDTRHAVPTAYEEEWRYLCAHTDLWHLWQGPTPEETAELQAETPDGQVLVECLGAAACQREFRTITCRAFPFFPYLDSGGNFLGMSYYWEYADRCWVANNLQAVTPAYRRQFIEAYEQIFAHMPAEKETFARHSAYMRREFIRRRRRIPLLHRNGNVYQISPRSERLRRCRPEDLPKYGPYRIAAWLPFPDEMP